MPIVTIQCAYCHKPRRLESWYAKRQLYCSKSCARLARPRVRIKLKPCANDDCRQLFALRYRNDPRRFCSIKCGMAVYRNTPAGRAAMQRGVANRAKAVHDRALKRYAGLSKMQIWRGGYSLGYVAGKRRGFELGYEAALHELNRKAS